MLSDFKFGAYLDNLCLVNPFLERGSFFLADYNKMLCIYIFRIYINFQLYFFISSETPNMVNINYVLAIRPEKNAFIKFTHQFGKISFHYEFFTCLIDGVGDLIFCIKESNIVK